MEWSAVGIIVTTNIATLGLLARQIARLDDRVSARFDRVEERLDRHLEHHARFA